MTEGSGLIRGLEGVVAAETQLCDLDGANGRLAALLRQHRDVILRTEGTTLGHPGRAEKALAEQRALLAALQARDGEAAARAAREHLEEARRLRLQLHFERARP